MKNNNKYFKTACLFDEALLELLTKKEIDYIFTASLKNPYSMKVFTKYDHIKKYILNPILDRFNVPQIERKYLLNFYISGIIAIIKEWLNDDCKDDIAMLEDIIIKYVNS